MNIFAYVLFFLFLLFSSTAHAEYYIKNFYDETKPSYNSVAQTGLIHLPNASFQEVGSVGVTFGNSSLNKLISVIATPFPWMEASFFYHRPRDTLYTSNKKVYLDKGFNIKLGFTYSGIDLALGIDDIAGTGFLSKEYIVATINKNNVLVTLGFGTGAFSKDHPYENPISKLRDRPNPLFDRNNNTGGEIDFNALFKGPVGIFGGIEFNISSIPGLAIKIESSPFNYKEFLAGGILTEKFSSNRKKDKDFNFGIYYRLKNDYV